MSKSPHIALLAAVIAGTAFQVAARTEDADVPDPHQWLEAVEDPKALAWVRERNAEAESEIASGAGFRKLEADILAILDSDAKIPAVEKIGAHYYNFWKDAGHERGIWRRTTLDEYRKPAPAWETVLDLDALNRAEGENWVWHGAECLRPDYTRCLVALS
ncbi:MAG TPA: S9 family peptidase, partial [Luteimonas sp.]|nr:S9 family peptidase [Luteimonas sp.]